MRKSLIFLYLIIFSTIAVSAINYSDCNIYGVCKVIKSSTSSSIINNYYNGTNGTSFNSTYDSTSANAIVNNSNTILKSIVTNYSISIQGMFNNSGGYAYFGNTTGGGRVCFGNDCTNAITYASNQLGFFTTQTNGFHLVTRNVSIDANLSVGNTIYSQNYGNFSGTLGLNRNIAVNATCTLQITEGLITGQVGC